MKTEVKIKSIGSLQSGEKRDGSGQWFAKELVLETADGSMYPDEFVVRVTGETAKNWDVPEGKLCQADISFSTREYNGRNYQDLWLRELAPIEAPQDPLPAPPLGGEPPTESPSISPKGEGAEGTEELPF